MPDEPSPRDLLAQIHTLADKLPRSWDAPRAALQPFREEIRALLEKLSKLYADLDHVRQPDFVFDPSDPKIVGTLIGRTLLEQPFHDLASVDDNRFYGSGVYAIYYAGSFDAYAPISGTNVPIYVGKVDPADHSATNPTEQGDRLWNRLARDHAKNIKLANSTLQVADFKCRYLVVKSAWQNTAETYLINMFKPIWNNEIGICFGFGKHGDSSNTRKNTRSPWDTLHPGRPWASDKNTVPNPQSIDQIKAAIAAHFAKHPPKNMMR